MEDVTKNVAVAVPHQDAGAAQIWYQTIKDVVYSEDGQDWETFKSKFNQEAASHFDSGSINMLFDSTEAYSADPMATIVDLVNADIDELVMLYQDTMGGSEGGEYETEEGAKEAGELDQEAWGAFLAGLNNMWDGNEETWQQFAEWARYNAYEQGEAMGQGWDSLAEYATGSGDMAAAMEAYGVMLAAKESK